MLSLYDDMLAGVVINCSVCCSSTASVPTSSKELYHTHLYYSLLSVSYFYEDYDLVVSYSTVYLLLNST